MEIVIRNEQKRIELCDEYEDLMRQCVEYVQEIEKVPEPSEIGIMIVDDKDIKLLNRDYRGIDRETDVLSFSVFERSKDERQLRSGCPVMLGDIVISLQRAQNQAEEYGHTLERELAFLTAHGMLHLLGYDHEDEESEAVMRKKQQLILEKLKLDR